MLTEKYIRLVYYDNMSKQIEVYTFPNILL